MKIEEAVKKAYEAGMAIKRASASTDVIIDRGKLQSPRISFLKTCNGRMYAPSREDLIADDWEVVEHSEDRSRWNPMEWVEYLRYGTEVDEAMLDKADRELKHLIDLLEAKRRIM